MKSKLYYKQTGDIGAFKKGEGGRFAATLSKKLEHLVVDLFRVGQVDSLQGVREEMVKNGGSVGRGELLMPAHSL